VVEVILVMYGEFLGSFIATLGIISISILFFEIRAFIITPKKGKRSFV